MFHKMFHAPIGWPGFRWNIISLVVSKCKYRDNNARYTLTDACRKQGSTNLPGKNPVLVKHLHLYITKCINYDILKCLLVCLSDYILNISPLFFTVRTNIIFPQFYKSSPSQKRLKCYVVTAKYSLFKISKSDSRHWFSENTEVWQLPSCWQTKILLSGQDFFMSCLEFTLEREY